MVAISLYKGNLHKVPDVPRRWLTPAPNISVKDFKNLLHRRARTLARLSSSTISNPNPKPILNDNDDEKNEIDDCDDKTEVFKVKEEVVVKAKDGEVEDEKKLDGGDCFEKLVEESDALVEVKHEGVVESVENEVNALVKDDDATPRVLPEEEEEEEEDEEEEKAEGVDVNPSSEIDKKEDVPSDKEKRRREIEEKLQILNKKKHSLVQVLKQILSAEEELKRRSMQGMAVRPPVALQVDTTHDPGSVSRLNTPRMGSDGNVNNEAEGGETDDINHNVHSRHLLHTSSTSPSSDSQQRKPTLNVQVPLPSRTNSGVANSPSRFALTGQQGRPSNLPSVSVSGTNYVPSSPSPAASGATSAFRDGRIPSPWN